MKKYVIEINYSKYMELREDVADPNTLALEGDWSRKYYKFDVVEARASGWPKEHRVAVISFGNEQDLIWFTLAHL